MKIPKSVKIWADIFISQGENKRSATFHAIQRAYEEGKINEKKANLLEQQLKKQN